MSKDKGIISIYLSTDEMKELDRRAIYQRLSRNQWVKSRVLAILGKSHKPSPQPTKSKNRGV